MVTQQVHDYLLSATRGSNSDLNKLISQNGMLALRRRPASQLFEFMFNTVVGQQLSTAAARSIRNKVENECIKRSVDLFDMCIGQRKSILKSCGLSNNKIKAVNKLRKAFVAEEINSTQVRTASYQEVTDTITHLWGFGNWSADMIAIFFSGLTDVWPEGDGAIQRGLKILSLKPSARVIKQCSPYRSYLALHIWRGLDTAVL